MMSMMEAASIPAAAAGGSGGTGASFTSPGGARGVLQQLLHRRQPKPIRRRCYHFCCSIFARHRHAFLGPASSSSASSWFYLFFYLVLRLLVVRQAETELEQMELEQNLARMNDPPEQLVVERRASIGVAAFPSSAGTLLWQWTDYYLATPMRTAEDQHEKFKAEMAKKHGNVSPAPDIGRLMRGAAPWDVYASLIKHNETRWEPLVYPGRNPLSMWRIHEDPASSESRLKRLEERYRPVVEKYILLGPPGRKHLLDQWIPAIEDAELEKALKNAIEEQWRLEIAPGQKNDPDRLPRKLPDGQERPAEAFVLQSSGSADEEGGEADDAATVGADEEGTTAEERGSYKNLKNRIRELERTFGFGYQLLRSCAVDGYEMPFFQEHVERKWLTIFQQTQVWTNRTLRAMKPPPGAGLAGDKLGEESLPGGPGSALREQTRRDRILLWERLKTFVQKYQSEASGGGAGLLLGPVSIMLGKGLGRTERSTNETLADAVRSIFTLSANPERLNAGDKEQEGTGERLSLYPEGLTLADKAVFRARRDVIEGERQREDLKIYVGQRMQLLQSAFLPIAYAYNPDFGAGTHDVEEQLVEDLNRAADGGEGAESDNTNAALSPLAKTLAKQAADGLKEFRALEEPHFHGDVATASGTDSPLMLKQSDEHEAERDAEVLNLYESTACVRLFAWASRHQLLGRMLRQNLLVRLKALATDPPKFGRADLIERETPTAVGAVTNQTGSPLALKENREYTNLFFLLRDNVGRKLDEVPPLQWKDFDNWGLLYPGLVRTTPWDKEYVPPWKWPGGIPPDRRRTKKAVKRAANSKDEKDGSYYRNWFYTAVTGIAVFAVGLAAVFVRLVMECRRSAALRQKRQTTKLKIAGQQKNNHDQALPPAEGDRREAGAPRQRRPGGASARQGRGREPKIVKDVVATASREQNKQNRDRGFPNTRYADYRLDVRDQQPPPTLQKHWDDVAQQEELQAVMGLQLQSHDGLGENPPPVNPHADDQTATGSVDDVLLLVLPNRNTARSSTDMTVATGARAPPNSSVTGARSSSSLQRSETSDPERRTS